MVASVVEMEKRCHPNLKEEGRKQKWLYSTLGSWLLLCRIIPDPRTDGLLAPIAGGELSGRRVGSTSDDLLSLARLM